MIADFQWLKIMLPLLVVIFSCSGKIEIKNDKTSELNFDLNDYVQNQITRLSSSEDSIKRVLKWDEKTETQFATCQQIKWEKELSMFKDLNINKPAWKGIFNSDTTQINSDYKKINRTVDLSKGDNIPVKSFYYYQNNNNEIKGIGGEIIKDDLLTKTQIQLNFESEKGYHIMGHQTIRNLNIIHTYSVNGTFLKSK